MGTWALTQEESNKLDAFHRTQLRRVIGIRYPDKISLYKRTGSKPVSEEMYSDRWRLLGHTLRMDDKIPAKAAMIFYFSINAKTNQCGPRTTLPVSINNDLKNIREAASRKRGRKKATIESLPAQLTSMNDLRTLERLAQDRKKWQQIVSDTQALLKERGEQSTR